MERSRLDGIPRAGGFLGGMACNALGGLQCEAAWSAWLFGGWQGVFTLWGVSGLGFGATWPMLVILASELFGRKHLMLNYLFFGSVFASLASFLPLSCAFGSRHRPCRLARGPRGLIAS